MEQKHGTFILLMLRAMFQNSAAFFLVAQVGRDQGVALLNGNLQHNW